MMTTATTDRACRPTRTVVPPFVPHPLLPNAHLQTVIGRFFSLKRDRVDAVHAEVDLGDGDRLSVLDSRPEGWHPGRPQAALVHGLCGCANSAYVVRLAARLVRKGVRVARVNLRGAGSGFGLAKGTYHAGRSDDLRRAVEWIVGDAPGSPTALVGFSLGANIVLKLAGEAVGEPLGGFDCVLAANPPIDLAECCRHIQRSVSRVYDRNFVRQLKSDVARLHRAFPELGPVNLPQKMSLYQFDDLYTAPRNGFSGAAEYYARSSSAPLIPSVQAPGLVVHSLDDPFIPAGPFLKTSFPPNLELELVPAGGHLGYVSRSPWDGDHRWLTTRLTAWLCDRWGLNSAVADRV
ncbi:MAG: alpha/beta fold hydrolase [Isosphaeraceae bacterium]